MQLFRHHRIWLFVGTLLAALAVSGVGRAASAWAAVSSAPAAAPAPSIDEIELVGPLTAVDGNRWTVGEAVVIVSPVTEVKGAPAIGMLVKVHATLATDGTFAAREVEPAAADAQAGQDDRGQDDAAHDQNDDHGQDAATPEPGDDHSHDAATPEPGDDHGQDTADDNSGSGRSGGHDDNKGGKSGKDD